VAVTSQQVLEMVMSHHLGGPDEHKKFSITLEVAKLSSTRVGDAMDTMDPPTAAPPWYWANTHPLHRQLVSCVFRLPSLACSFDSPLNWRALLTALSTGVWHASHACSRPAGTFWQRCWQKLAGGGLEAELNLKLAVLLACGWL
jgi:hypothetical protein